MSEKKQNYTIGSLKVSLDKIKQLGESKAIELELHKKLLTMLAKRELVKLEYTVLKRSLDLRKKMQASFIYKLALPNLEEIAGHTLLQQLLEKNIVTCEAANYVWSKVQAKLSAFGERSAAYLANSDSKRPIVVGFGPAGIFAALLLAEAGLKPIVIERGEAIDKRVKDFQLLQTEGKFNPNSNAQFGEGGAGCFSDGKLGTRIKDDLLSLVLDVLVSFGADKSILWRQNPHVGTDKLRPIIKQIRQHIIALGGEVRFSTKLVDIELEPNLRSITVEKADSTREKIVCTQLILAPGHSARDLYHLLYAKGQKLSAKAFAVGFRIEQKQKAVNLVQYGPDYENLLTELLGPAEYHLACKVDVDGEERRVYTFCMCPGGEVIASASESGALCVNGMSYQERAAENANAAVICAVNSKDFGEDLFAGMNFQAQVEQAAYQMTGSYNAPYMKVCDFVEKSLNQVDKAALFKETDFAENLQVVKADKVLHELCQLDVKPSYLPGVVAKDLSQLYPAIITRALAKGILKLNKQMHCFASSKSNLIAPETRTSAPLRIERDKDSLMAASAMGLYPCGEGAGYAGGISSAAVDGLKIALKIIANCCEADISELDLM